MSFSIALVTIGILVWTLVSRVAPTTTSFALWLLCLRVFLASLVIGVVRLLSSSARASLHPEQWGLRPLTLSLQLQMHVAVSLLPSASQLSLLQR